jgi:adenine-specific DNA methylase
LLKFIGEASNWQLAAHRPTLEVARELVAAAFPDDTPLVADPFSGGGSIPLEALRLGCDVFSSDLNPVALMILRIMLQHIPRDGAELSDKLRKKGEELLRETVKRFESLYPSGASGRRPMAYLWARTVRCESPDCGAEIPIFRSPWLAKRGSTRARFFKEDSKGDCTVVLIDSAPKGGPITFRIARGFGSQEMKPGYEPAMGTKVPGRTASVLCPCCKVVLPGKSKQNRTAAQLSAQKGGADVVFDPKGNRIGGAFLLAVAEAAQRGKTYRLAEVTDYQAVLKAQKELQRLEDARREDGQSVIPEETLPLMSGTFNVPIYGVNRWGDMFSARQKLAMLHLCGEVAKISDPSLKVVMAAVLGRCADYWSAGTRWVAAGEFIANTFGRQALGMIWDFAEACPWGDSGGNLDGAIDWVARVIDAWPGNNGNSAEVQQEDSQEHPLPDESVSVWFTDPPYYFAVPYADLSDYFFVWLKRAYSVDELVKARFRTTEGLVPKDQELCEMAHWDTKRYAHKDQAYFESGMRKAFAEGRRVLKPDGIGCVVFAHKTTEGWEALLSGIVGGGWVITASWPIATERPTRLRSKDSAALATSVHLVCRPRPEDAPIGDWTHVIRELPKRVSEWIERLQSEGVRGADLVFACIGPALEIYSRYSKVVDAEDREIPLGGDPEATTPHERGYLAAVWETVGRAALEQVLGRAGSSSGVLEEDARLTALFLWTLQATEAEVDESDTEEEESEEDETDEEEEGSGGKKKGGFSLVYDVARRFAQPLGIHLEDWENRVIETKKGTVRLLPVSERAEQLFGKDGAEAVADRLDAGPKKASDQQLTLFDILEEVGEDPTPKKGRRKKGAGVADDALKSKREATTLDRVHAAMLLQTSGRTNALRTLLKDEVARGGEFLRLANALSALYPQGCEEKRLLDAMLLAMPR